MRSTSTWHWPAIAFSLIWGLAGCQSGGAPSAPMAPPAATPTNVAQLTLPAPEAWGGEARCGAQGCRIILVEHGVGQLDLFRLSGRQAALVDKHPLAYHPDSAKWLNDDWVVAAVERDFILDFFRIDQGKLVRGAKVNVGFPPRDVVVVAQQGKQYTLVATPYNGKQVAFVEWAEGAPEGQVTKVEWCEAPWHPKRVDRMPGVDGPALVVACLDDKKVVAAPLSKLGAPPRTIADFKVIPRNVAASASGEWLYVALETGGQNARIDVSSGSVQYLKAPVLGGASVAPLADGSVAWGDGDGIFLHRYSAQGEVLEQRWLKTSGFPSNVQALDLDGDGHEDLIAYNSAGKMVDVYFGPLWQLATVEK